MSILIKGMEKPKHCGVCPFNVLSVNEITGEYKKMCFVRKKKIEPLQDCPLVGIPTLTDKVGEWLKDVIAGVELYFCSECGSPLMTDDINENHYCPNCGARMESEE